MTSTATAPARTSTTVPALEIHDLVLEYPDGADRTLRALDAVSMRLRRGEFTALVGPSGSGKSSLLAVAGGLITPTSGDVLIDGEETARTSRRRRTALRGEKIGMIFQQPNLLASLTSLEQLELTRVLRGGPARTAREQARELLERVGMGHAAHKRPHQLSGGMRQRVNIARALMGSPSLLLVDEPTSALDQQRSEEVVELLAGITHERDVATLMVTHDVEFTAVTDRTLTMRDGRLA